MESVTLKFFTNETFHMKCVSFAAHSTLLNIVINATMQKGNIDTLMKHRDYRDYLKFVPYLG